MALRNWKVISLPGFGRFQIPVTGTQKNNENSGISKVSREWRVAINSTVLELFGFSTGATRETLGHATGPLFSSPATQYSDLVIIVENTGHSPIFEQMMNDGTLIKTVTIDREGWINGSFCTLEKRIFEDCYITQFRQVLDFLVLFIRTLNREEITHIYDQTGNPSGQVIVRTSPITGIME